MAFQVVLQTLEVNLQVCQLASACKTQVLGYAYSESTQQIARTSERLAIRVRNPILCSHEMWYIVVPNKHKTFVPSS
jgi:hypothetical protein